MRKGFVNEPTGATTGKNTDTERRNKTRNTRIWLCFLFFFGGTKAFKKSIYRTFFFLALVH